MACWNPPHDGRCDGNPCDDGLYCNGVEACTLRDGVPTCGDGTPIECEFGFFCDEELDECVDYCAAVVCDDGNVCTDDSCNPLNGECVGTYNTDACDDGDPCTDNDVCSDGVCTGTPFCDDGDACTHDACADGNCTSTPVDCDDGVECTDDLCDIVTGGCVYQPNDDNCDIGEVCDPVHGCVNP
jgi:hypothetical protein